MGCGWKNRRGACVGRKEMKFLKELKKKDRTVAKYAILRKYGDINSVQIIKAVGMYMEDFVLNRIRLFLNKGEVVKRVPKFRMNSGMIFVSVNSNRKGNR